MPADAMGGINADQMGMMPPDAMAGMNGDMMAAIPGDAMAAMSDAQMDMVPPDAVPQATTMDMDDGGMGALDAALEPAPVQDLAPMDPSADAVTGAMDAAQIQGGDSAPADAAAMDQVAAGPSDMPEVDEAPEAPLSDDSTV